MIITQTQYCHHDEGTLGITSINRSINLFVFYFLQSLSQQPCFEKSKNSTAVNDVNNNALKDEVKVNDGKKILKKKAFLTKPPQNERVTNTHTHTHVRVRAFKKLT